MNLSSHHVTRPADLIMENSDISPLPKVPKTLPGKIFDLLSGFGLATVLLLMLGLLTWFATLEQIDNGLYPTLKKYFYWKSVFLLPEYNGKMVPLPMLSGYWVGALLLVNLILGGVIRIRKGWKHAGNIISHLGIIFMLIGAGVSQHFSERGNMAVGEGESSNTAEDYFEYVVEVSEIKDAKARRRWQGCADDNAEVTKKGGRHSATPHFSSERNAN